MIVNISVVALVTSSVIMRRDNAHQVVPLAGQVPDANTVSATSIIITNLHPVHPTFI